MLSFASLMLLVTVVVVALLVALASRALRRGEHARWMPDSALGLELAISVIIALAALWIFAERARFHPHGEGVHRQAA